MRGFLRRFFQNNSGNFAMLFGICAIPLMGMVGLGVDVTRAYIAQVRLQGAVDNAALAAATLAGQSDKVIKDQTEKYFYSNYRTDFWAPPTKPVVTITNGNVRVEATATQNNYFLVLFGHDTFTVATAAEAVGQAHGLEVVLVLDITTSMAGAVSKTDSTVKMTAMKSAANSLVDILFGDTTINDKLKVGLVPFAAAVRLNPATAVAKGWIDTTGTSKYARQNFDNNQFAYQIYTNSNGSYPDEMTNVPWQGCVEARPNGLEETDTAPTAGAPDSRWVPFFSPDNPDDVKDKKSPVDGLKFKNSYLSDVTTIAIIGKVLEIVDALTKHQNYSAKYKGKTPSTDTGTGVSGPGRMCVDSTIMAMISDKQKVKDAITALKQDGYTHVQLGVGWGWRLLSPGEPYTEGKAYSDTEWEKALIILTDGDNTMPDDGVSGSGDINKSEYTAYGFAAQARLGAGIDTPAEVETEQNESLKRTCNNIKAVKKPDGSSAIHVYTIAFGDEVSDDGIRTLLENCASSKSNYFYAPSSDQLKTAFKKIGNDLSNIRLTK